MFREIVVAFILIENKIDDFVFCGVNLSGASLVATTIYLHVS